MRHKITDRTLRAVERLGFLSGELRRWLHAASRPAREEWDRLRLQLPSSEELRSGAIALSDEELERIEAKVRRFRDILCASSKAPARLSIAGGSAAGQTIAA